MIRTRRKSYKKELFRFIDELKYSIKLIILNLRIIIALIKDSIITIKYIRTNKRLDYKVIITYI